MGMASIGVQVLIIMGVGCLVPMIAILLINATVRNGTMVNAIIALQHFV
jgi:hypothetical protein